MAYDELLEEEVEETTDGNGCTFNEEQFANARKRLEHIPPNEMRYLSYWLQKYIDHIAPDARFHREMGELVLPNQQMFRQRKQKEEKDENATRALMLALQYGFITAQDFLETRDTFLKEFKYFACKIAHEMLDQGEKKLEQAWKQYNQEWYLKELMKVLGPIHMNANSRKSLVLGQNGNFKYNTSKGEGIMKEVGELDKQRQHMINQNIEFFPILGDKSIDPIELAEYYDNPEELLNFIHEEGIKEKRDNIQKAREYLQDDPSLIFELTPVLNLSKDSLKIARGTALDALIWEKVKLEESNKKIRQVILSGLSVAFALTGSGALMLLGMGLGATDTVIEANDYIFHSAARNIAFVEKDNLSEKNPHLWGVAIAFTGTLGDAGGLLFKKFLNTYKGTALINDAEGAARQAEEFVRAQENLTEVERTNFLGMLDVMEGLRRSGFNLAQFFKGKILPQKLIDDLGNIANVGRETIFDNLVQGRYGRLSDKKVALALRSLREGQMMAEQGLTLSDFYRLMLYKGGEGVGVLDRAIDLPRQLDRVLPNEFWDEFLKRNKRVKVELENGDAGVYNHVEKKLGLGRAHADTEAIIAAIHEYGHGYHYWKKLIREGRDAFAVADKIDKYFIRVKNLVNQYPDETLMRLNEGNRSSLFRELRPQFPHINDATLDRFMISTSDFIKATTNNRFGYGHEDIYFVKANSRQMEIFAESCENYFFGNPVFEHLLPDVYEESIKFMRDEIFR